MDAGCGLNFAQTFWYNKRHVERASQATGLAEHLGIAPRELGHSRSPQEATAASAEDGREDSGDSEDRAEGGLAGPGRRAAFGQRARGAGAALPGEGRPRPAGGITERAVPARGAQRRGGRGTVRGARGGSRARGRGGGAVLRADDVAAVPAELADAGERGAGDPAAFGVLRAARRGLDGGHLRHAEGQ